MKKLDIKHFELVRAIESEGSLTKAADKLCLTQPALSHQLKDVERRLGEALFIRAKKRLYPTETGRKVLLSGEKILKEVEQLELNIDHTQKGLEGNIRICTQGITAHSWIPQLTKVLNEEGCDISFEIVIEATNDPFFYINNGKLDFALVSEKLDRAGIEYDNIFEDELVIVMSNKHAFATKEYLELEHITNERVFWWSQDLREGMSSELENSIKKNFRTELTESIFEHVSLNLGVAVLPAWVVRPNTDCCNLSMIPITENGISIMWYLAYASDTGSKPKIFNKAKHSLLTMLSS